MKKSTFIIYVLMIDIFKIMNHVLLIVLQLMSIFNWQCIFPIYFKNVVS